MVNIDINYYRLAYFSDFTRLTYDGEHTDTNPIGNLAGDIWGYYNDSNPDNVPYRGQPLNDSIYLWKINPNASFARNACISVKNQNNLNCEVKQNIELGDVPLAMSLYTVSGSWSDSGLRVNPKTRLAYDETVIDSQYGGWRNSQLFYNINPLKFCLFPQIAIFDRAANDQQLKTLDNMATHINAAPDTRRVVLITSSLYCGDDLERTNTDMYNQAGDPRAACALNPDILTDRPICDNLSSTVGKYIRDMSEVTPHPDYIIDKVYSPFNQAMSMYFFGSWLYTCAAQLDIGYYIDDERETFTNGAYEIPGGYGRASAFWAKMSDYHHVFNDVAYHWRPVVFSGESLIDLPEGYDLTNYGTTSDIKLFSELVIDDEKDAPTYGEACRRAVLHELAFIGFWFTDTEAKAASDPLGTTTTGAGVYLPEKRGGVTTGEYFTGADIKSVPYANADSVEAFEYEPAPTADTGDFNTVINTGTIGAGVKYYALDNTQMNSLCTWLNTTYEPTDEDTFIQDFKGTNPADYLTTVMYYPFDIPLSAGVDEQIVIGKLNAGGTTGRALDYTYGREYDFGSYTIPEQGNFMDYMRKITVFVPFCGSVELDPLIWTGRRLSVKMQIDFPTGVCTAFLYRDSDRGNGVFATLSGNIGVPLPLSAVSNGSYQVAITNLLAAHKSAHRSMIMAAGGVAGGIGSAIVGAASGNLTVAAGGILSAAGGLASIDAGADKMENIDYNIDHTRATVDDVSGGSPFINCGTDYRVKILILTPILDRGYNSDAYGKTTGFACCKQGVLSNISRGFTQCAAADLSGIACTATEKNMIFAALQSGVII